MVSNLSNKKLLPWLSVPQLNETVPRVTDPKYLSGIKTMTETKMPSDSREAIVLKASPLAKAQGAFLRFSFTANQSASRVRLEPLQRHPPMDVSVLSALASSLAEVLSLWRALVRPRALGPG